MVIAIIEIAEYNGTWREVDDKHCGCERKHEDHCKKEYDKDYDKDYDYNYEDHCKNCKNKYESSRKYR